MGLERSSIERPPRGQGRVIAVFSYRYEADLVPDLIANLAPAVQGWVAWDDRGAEATLSNEPARRNALAAAARDAGADWILAVDPDERFESALAQRIRDMAARGVPPTFWTFRVCELFTPEAFRVDGIWGEKRQVRLFPAASAAASDMPLHGTWGGHADIPLMDSHLRLYHLRMASPRRRQHRRDTYARADPERRFQAIGYDYLTDLCGISLERVEPDRRFHPPFVEDHGIWAADPVCAGPAPPDPPAARLRYIQCSRHCAGAASAERAMAVLLEQGHGEGADEDLLALSAQLALESCEPQKSERIADAAMAAGDDHAPDLSFFRLLRGRARLWSGDTAGAAADFEELRRAVPESGYVADLLTLARSCPLESPEARWRRWAGPEAELCEGHRVAEAPLAVVIIGCGAPSSLRRAVASVLEQDVAAEVVVVNSAGGAPREVLAPYLDRIRLISCRDRLFPGAARNVGVEASRAPFVAFLASDCSAMPGWSARRIARHGAGAVAVANPVVPDRPENLVSRAANFATHLRRQPDTPPDVAARYGVSYARVLFAELGFFPPGIRTGEDDAFNNLLARSHRIDWAPEVITTHQYPAKIRQMALDQFRRGHRYASHAPNVSVPGKAAAMKSAVVFARRRRNAAMVGMRRDTPRRRARRAALGALISLAVLFHALGLIYGGRRIARAERQARKIHDFAKTNRKQAERARRAALELHDQNWSLHRNLAGALHESAPDAASEHYRRAVALALQRPEPTLDLSRRYQAQGRQQEALDVLEKAIALAPNCCELWRRAAELAHEAKKPAKALFYARGSLVLAPTAVTAHSQLLAVYTASRNRNGAHQRRRWIDFLETIAPSTAGRQISRISPASTSTCQERSSLDPRSIRTAGGALPASRPDRAPIPRASARPVGGTRS